MLSKTIRYIIQCHTNDYGIHPIIDECHVQHHDEKYYTKKWEEKLSNSVMHAYNIIDTHKLAPN